MVFMLPVLRPLNIISQLRQLGALYVLPAMHLSFTVGYFYTAKKGFMVACSDCCLSFIASPPFNLSKKKLHVKQCLVHPQLYRNTNCKSLLLFFLCRLYRNKWKKTILLSLSGAITTV